MGNPNNTPSHVVPGFHIVGLVHAIGEGVNPAGFLPGDHVAALLPQGGGSAKYISLPNHNLIKLPKYADHDDIVCLVANYMAAYQCLKLSKKDGAPLTGANVLITGGSGPVGQALVELALQEGAKVYATAHRMHESHIKKLGAVWFNIRPKKWLPLLEGKMDVVIDNLCMDGSYEPVYRALTPDGVLVCNTSNHCIVKLPRPDDSTFCPSFGDQSFNSWWSGIKAKYVWNRTVSYDLNESFLKNPKIFAHELKYLVCKRMRGEISPKVAGRVSLDQVPKAQTLIEKVRTLLL